MVTSQIISFIVAGAVGALLVFAIISNSKIQDVRLELKFMKLEISNLQKDVQATQMIAQQVVVAGSAGPNTVEKFNVTGKLSSILLKRFNMAELKLMSDDLNLNGSIEWASQMTAVQTILEHMYKHDKLIEIVKYIGEHREDIHL